MAKTYIQDANTFLKMGPGTFDNIIDQYERLALNVPDELKWMPKMYKGEFTLIGAPTGHGKSYCMLQLASKLSCYYNTLYVSCENGPGTDAVRLKQLNMSNDLMYIPVTKARKFIGYILPATEDEKVDELLLNESDFINQFDLIFIDGMEKIAASLAKDAENRYMFMHDLTVNLTQRFSNAHIVFSWQLNRSNSKSFNPDKDCYQVDDFAYSYAVVGEAAGAITINYRPSRNEYALYTAKARNLYKLDKPYQAKYDFKTNTFMPCLSLDQVNQELNQRNISELEKLGTRIREPK